MAIYHLTAKVMKRSEGRNALHAAAYRSGERLADERTGHTYDYTRRKGVEHVEIMAPPGSPAWVYDRTTLWNRIEAFEKRKDAQLAREVEFALPRELSREQCVELARAFIGEEFVARGMIADFAIHRTKAADGGDHPHCHVMLTMRPLEGDGFGKKARDWNAVELLEHWRAAWAGTANDALTRAGELARIDHRSHAEQGISKEPQPYLGIALKLKDLTGRIRQRVNQWVAVKQRNELRPVIEQFDQADLGTFVLKVNMLLERAARAFGVELKQEKEIGIER